MIRYTRELKLLIIKAWRERNRGAHCWIHQGNRWVTVVPDDDYLLVELVDEIDALGYPLSDSIAWDIIQEEDLKNLRITISLHELI